MRSKGTSCILRLVGIKGADLVAPDDLGQLSALQTLDLSAYSELTAFPEEVGQLSAGAADAGPRRVQLG
jgi:hypothetical protein